MRLGPLTFAIAAAFLPAPAPAQAPAPPPPPPPVPIAPRLAGNQAVVEGGKALVNLVCGGDAACEGKLSLLGSTATASRRCLSYRHT